MWHDRRPMRLRFALLRIWRLLEPSERRRIAYVAPLLVVSALVEVVGVAAVIPFLTVLSDPASFGELPLVGGLVARAGIDDPMILLRWAGAALALTLLAANGLLLLTTWWMLRFTWGLNHTISARLVRHYLAQPYPFMLTRNTSEMANRIVVEVRQLVENGVKAGLEVATRSAVILALAGFLVVLDPRTAAVAFVALGGAYGAIFALTRGYLRRIGREVVVASAARLKAVSEALGGFKDVRVAGREASVYRRYAAPSVRYAQIQAAGQAVLALPRYALQVIAVGGLVLIASLGVDSAEELGGIVPLLGAYAFAGLRMMPAMDALFGAFSRMRFGLGSLEVIEADLSRCHDLEPMPEVDVEPLPFEREVRLVGVTFAYEGSSAAAVQDVDLRLPIRSSVAVVGSTGSGKTTLVDLLLGLLAPSTGEVRVDDRLVTAETRRAYRRLFGYVPQSIFLLDDSVARNVAFGLEDADIDLAAVRRACREAQIAEFIESELPDGYETEVGERGVRLSGGQRQRIGIARALYHQPQILVFDEATSALDVHTEQQVYQALESIAEHRTVLTIAHRLETVAKADHVVVLERGQVVDRGPSEAVLTRYRFGVPA